LHSGRIGHGKIAGGMTADALFDLMAHGGLTRTT